MTKKRRSPQQWFYYPRGTYNPIEYIASNVSILAFHVGLALFAWTELLPEPNPLMAVEVAVVSLSVAVAAVVLIRLLAPRVDNFVTQYVYLFSISSALLTTFAFVLGEDEVTVVLRTIIFLFLTMGMGVSLQLHIAYGGGRSRKSVAPRASESGPASGGDGPPT